MKVKKIAAVLLAGAMVVGIAGCAKEKEEPIKIATKPMTEQYILGEMLTQLIEEQTGYEVELTKGIGGGTSNIQPAMEKGEFDLYPEYTSSGWIMVLGHEAGEVSDEEMLSKLQEEYEKQYLCSGDNKGSCGSVSVGDLFRSCKSVRSIGIRR